MNKERTPTASKQKDSKEIATTKKKREVKVKAKAIEKKEEQKCEMWLGPPKYKTK